VLAGAASAACLLPSLDDLGGAGTTPVVDAAFVPSDATGDASDAPSGPFCATLSPKPTFCADFDDDDFPAGFDTLQKYGDANAVLDDGKLGDPARSFFASIPALAGTKDGAANLIKSFSLTPSQLRIEFDWTPVTLDATERGIAQIVFKNDIVTLWAKTGYARVSETSTLADGGKEYASGSLSKAVVAGTKIHVRWLISIEASKSSSSVTIDTVAAGFTSLNAYKYKSSPQVKIGMLYVDAPSTGWSTRLDNVVIDVK
jgi:hypothetical protein